MLLTWGPVVRLRNAARALGLTRLIGRWRNAAGYEERFGKAMLGAVRPGDTVWDVGANIGFYTEEFSKAVGEGGRVVAFEPVPGCFAQLSQRVAGRANVTLVNAGLGRESGTVTFDVGDGSVHPNARVIEDAAAAGGHVMRLPVYTGDDAARTRNIPPPNVAKIDVEGFELDVLNGMRGLLSSPACRDVFVEIHFGLLNERGMPKAPDRIVQLMREAGFAVKWVDASHIHASRA